MPSIHILLGYPDAKQKAPPVLLYCGAKASEAEAIRTKNTTAASFAVVSNPVIRTKNNPNFAPPAAIEPAVFPPELLAGLPVDSAKSAPAPKSKPIVIGGPPPKT